MCKAIQPYFFGGFRAHRMIGGIFTHYGMSWRRSHDSKTLCRQICRTDNRVYLRNLHEFNTTWLGCCNTIFWPYCRRYQGDFSTVFSSTYRAARYVYKTNWTTAGPSEIGWINNSFRRPRTTLEKRGKLNTYRQRFTFVYFQFPLDSSRFFSFDCSN